MLVGLVGAYVVVTWLLVVTLRREFPALSAEVAT
jgi:hypothetical protein